LALHLPHPEAAKEMWQRRQQISKRTIELSLILLFELS
jgi:hypothetical protein